MAAVRFPAGATRPVGAKTGHITGISEADIARTDRNRLSSATQRFRSCGIAHEAVRARNSSVASAILLRGRGPRGQGDDDE